jgi:uncharacterized protein (DUF433 family)
MGREIIPINYIERKLNSKKYKIVGSRLTVDFLSLFIDDPEWPVERISENYSLTPAEIYAAWSFYYDHKDEIDAHIAEQNADFEAHADESRARKAELLRRYEERTGKK